jgi:hypothetical protein
MKQTKDPARDVIGGFRRARLFGALSVLAMSLLFAVSARAQDSQFLFDATGNLVVQTAATDLPPRIIGQPQSQAAAPGDAVSFSVVAADMRDLIYQWRFNGADINGAIGPTILILNVAATNEGQYSVVLVNSSGSVTSPPAMLWYDANRNGMADSWEIAYFGNLTHTATGDQDGDGVSNLQEFLDDTNPTNSASVRFHLTLFNDGGVVQVVPNQSSYTNGQIVILTASPSNSFRAWTGDITTRSNTITLTMSTNRSEFAHFHPMDVTFTNSTGDWTVATNWDPNVVPGDGDNVYVISGTVTLNTNADCEAFTLGGPNKVPGLNGTGTLTVHGPSVWNYGTLNGSGRLVIAPESSLAFANSSEVGLSWALENGGNIQVYGAGGIGLASGAVITNRTGALVEIQRAAKIRYLTGAPVRFDNAGTFRKSVDPGTNTIDTSVSFNNYGLLEVQTGTLLFNGDLTNSGTASLLAGTLTCIGRMANNGIVVCAPGTSGHFFGNGAGNGTFTAPATALIEFGGAYTLNPGAQLNGTGLYRVSGGGLVANTDLSVQNLDLAAGLSGMGVLTVSNVLNWTAGFMSGSGRTLIAPGATLNISNNVTLDRTLENAGTSLCIGNGGVFGGTGAPVITNRAGALFDVRNNGSFTHSLTTCSFDNAGTFRKSLGTGTNTFDGAFIFNNYGAVELQSGTLVCNSTFLNNGSVTLSAGTTNRLGGSGTVIGTFTTPATALVEFGGSYTLNPGAQLNGAGLYRISGSGSLHANTDVAVQNLDLAFRLDGTGLVTVSNVINWTAGSMDGSGKTLIAAGATLNMNNPSDVTLNRTLENAGTARCTGNGGFFCTPGGAVITNRSGALFEVRNNAGFAVGLFSCRLDNAGTFRKSVATGTNVFGSAFAFNNYGVVDLRSGTVAANGGYTSSTGAMLNCAIGGTVPGTNFGRLVANTSIALNGGLSVGLTNGYVPTTNDFFTVLSANSRSGTFASFTYPSNLVTMQLNNTATSVIVRVTGVAIPPPAPVLLSPALSGTNVLLSWTAVSNITYRLEFNPNLAPSNWIALPGDVLGLSNFAGKLDALTPSNRFYRVLVLP